MTPFVGRERERAEMRSALDRMMTGQGQVVLLGGEPGIGKTRLGDEFAVEAETRGCRVAWGRCHEWEATPAYWPWIQVLRALIRDLEPDRLREQLGSGAAELAQIMPEIQRLLPGVLSRTDSAGEHARFRLFDSVTTLMTTLAREQPLVLIFDDLHWADTSSLLLLQFVTQQIRDASVMLVGAYRTVDVNRKHPLSAVLGDLAREQTVRRIVPHGLSTADIGRFMEAIAGRELPRGLVDAVHQKTEGNPFFANEIVRLIESEGGFTSIGADEPVRLRVPESVKDVVGKRLNRLTPACHQLLLIASIIGREFSLHILTAVSSQSTEEVLEALGEAIEARLIEMVAVIGAYRFNHVLVRETLYDELTSMRRLRLHQQVGDALEETSRTTPEPPLNELAYHYFHAAPFGDAEKAIDYAIRAASRSMTQYAWETAVGHYQQALQLLDTVPEQRDRQRCHVLLDLYEAQIRTGDFDDSAETFRRLVPIVHRLDDLELLIRAALGHVSMNLSVEWVSRERTLLLREAHARQASDDSIPRVKVLCQLALGLYWEPDTREQREALLEEAIAIARRLGDPETLAVALMARHDGARPSDLTNRLRLTDEIIRVAHMAGNTDLRSGGIHFRIMALLHLGDLPEAQRELERYEENVKRTRSAIDRTAVHWWRASFDLLAGRYRQGEQHLAEAVAATRTIDPFLTGPNVESLFLVRREQGRLTELEPDLDQVVARDPNIVQFRCLRMLLRLDLGRREEVIQEYRQLRADGFADALRDPNVIPWIVTMLSEIAIDVDDSEGLSHLYALLRPYASWNLSSFHGQYGSAAQYLGKLATHLSRWGDAVRHFEDAIAMNGRIGARPALALTRHAYADMLVRRGGPGDSNQARELNDEALTVARAIGMLRLARMATTLARRLIQEAHAVPDRAPSRFGLSSREREVLRLIAQGHSDREIAEMLFISRRTVTTHVTNILNKLGVDSRTAAAALAVRHDLA